MAAAALVVSAKSPVEQINEALRGSVVDVLRVLIPELEPYSNEEAFNVILNSPEVTARAFKAFRDHPEAFAHLIQGPDEKPVTNDNERLSCGRTLAQVVALVVQAVAKRYFRAKLSLRKPSASDQEQGLVEKVVALFKPAQPKKMVKTVGPSDRLFNAMRDYLLFEWQLRLIPHYVALPVSLVQALGSHILDYKEVEEIQWMARNGRPLARPYARASERAAPRNIMPAPPPISRHQAVANEPQPAAIPDPAPAPSSAPGGMAQQVEIPNVGLIQVKIPEGVDHQRFVGAVLGRVNAPLAKRLIQDLGLNAKQLAVMLIRAYEVMPSNEFARFGASAPDSHEANRFVAAALTARFGAKTDPATCTEFARLYMANVRSAV
jgi:hypothetical protein